MSSISKPSFDEVRRNIEAALQRLYKSDLFLITNSTNERTITHKFAEHIQQLFPEWHVDCEYNRRGEEQRKDVEGRNTTYPDIIIHRRNTKDNLLVIEAKSIHSQDHSDTDDKDKIIKYISDMKYSYSYGLWICFYDELVKTQLDWFENHAGECRGVSL